MLSHVYLIVSISSDHQLEDLWLKKRVINGTWGSMLFRCVSSCSKFIKIALYSLLEWKGGFLGMLLGSLRASLLWSISTYKLKTPGRGVINTGERIQARKGVIWVGEEVLKTNQGWSTINTITPWEGTQSARATFNFLSS